MDPLVMSFVKVCVMDKVHWALVVILCLEDLGLVQVFSIFGEDFFSYFEGETMIFFFWHFCAVLEKK